MASPVAPANNHISVLKGNLAPESCVLKLSGKTLEKGEFRGTARVFESEAETMKAIRAGEIVPGNVIVVRNVGPVGGPGMPEMVMLTIQLQGRGLGEDVALITDGRFSGVSHGILIGHISPEAARGGPIAAVRDGDTIVIDPGARTLNLDVPDDGDRPAHGRLAPARAGRAGAAGLGARQVHPAGVVGALRLRGLMEAEGTEGMDDIYDPKFVKGVFDRCSGRYITFSLICSLGFTERWRAQCVAAMPAGTKPKVTI